MAQALCRVVTASSVRIRLDLASGVQCPRFHVDKGRARLFKGKRWPGNETRGAIHCSPPVSLPHAPRVLVAFDMP